MIRRDSIIGLFFLFLLVELSIMVNVPSATAQGAKVQRKTAQLLVQPQLVIRGHEVHAVVQSYNDHTPLRLRLTRLDGEMLDQIPIEGDQPVHSITLSVPKETSGHLRVLLEACHGMNWMPAAAQEVQVLPKFGEDLHGLIVRAEQIEHQVKDSNPTLLRAAWAVLAYAEDLMERAKLAEVDSAWDVQRRMVGLRSKVEALENGKDPLAQSSGYQLRGYRSPVNGEIQLYSVHIPKGYGLDPEQKWPMAVMLHGAFSNHHLGLRRVFGSTNNRAESDASAKRFMPTLPDVPYIVIAPNGFETSWYKGYAEEDVWRVMEEAQSLFSIDDNRVYLTGLSMGGYGTAQLGLTHPDRFAAIAPVCGFFDEFILDKESPKPDYVKRFIQAKMPIEAAENAFQLPVKLMHGQIDPTVPVKNSIDLDSQFNKLGYSSEIELYPDVGHDAWVSAYENARIFDWFARYERNPFPKKVVYRSGNPTGGSSYWVRIDEPQKIRRFARIEAELSEHSITVITENIERFSLQVPESLIASDQVAQVTIDGKPIYEGTLGIEIAFIYQENEWEWTHDPAPTRLLPPEEGILAALHERHVFAYGTAGTDTENHIAQTLASTQSLPGEWADAQFPVLPESDLSPETMADHNVILFSTFKGSSFLHNHLDSLPIQMNGETLQIAGRTVKPDQAVLFIYPNPAHANRYLLVYTSATPEGLQSLRSFNVTPLSLYENAPGDFAVIDREGKFVWGGLFDKGWNIDEIGDFNENP